MKGSIGTSMRIVKSPPAVRYNLKSRCPKCNSKIKVRISKYGMFAGCSKYPKCDFTGKLSNRAIIQYRESPEKYKKKKVKKEIKFNVVLREIGSEVASHKKRGGTYIVVGHINCERCEKLIEYREQLTPSKSHKKMGHYWVQWSICPHCGLYSHGNNKISI